MNMEHSICKNVIFLLVYEIVSAFDDTVQGTGEIFDENPNELLFIFM